jgi:hypothetical protein
VSNLAREHPITVNMAMSFSGTKKEMDVQGRLILIIARASPTRWGRRRGR